MGRQPYIIRLALGRSPYEPPQNPDVSRSHTPLGRNSPHSADGYVQQYDNRGHPVFPQSRALARDLRRAKNDVLSTMGVVVSGEAGRSGVSKDKKSVASITAENDYGLVIVAFDHIMHFLGSWWVGALGRRVQTFKTYTSVPLIRLLRFEGRTIGWSPVLFAGMPLWAARVALPICRTQIVEPFLGFAQKKLITWLKIPHARLLENFFALLRVSTRTASFMIFQQIHMFCILQTLQIIPHSAFPRLSMLLPFTKFSLIQSPPLPHDLSIPVLGRFVSGFATSPFTFAFAYVLLRPFIEDRVYRIIRRHLPKQDRPDELSIQVAMDNDLLEWTLPTAGRRTEDEVRRSNLTFFGDIKEEFQAFHKWSSQWLGFILDRENHTNEKLSECISQNDIDTVRENNLQNGPITDNVEDPSGELRNPRPISHLDASFIPDQSMAYGRFTHSPSEITPNSVDENHPMATMEAQDVPLQPEAQGTSWVPFRDYDQDSRSDTLFSRPTSPESPLTSPRIRASLTHQNSFTTTMELSLQSSRNANAVETQDPLSETGRGDTASSNWSIPVDQSDLSISESVSNQVDQSTPVENVGQPSLTVADFRRSNSISQAEADLVWEVLNGNPVLTDLERAAILPHVVEEPLHNVMDQTGMDQTSETGTEQSALRRQSQSLPPWRPRSQYLPDSHKQRITVLSSYPADALAHHLASLISGVLFIPFESFFYRSLARAYLSSPAALLYGDATNHIAYSNIRGLNAFAGGGSRQDMVAYMSKLALIFGLQAGVSGAILGMCSAAAIGFGKKLFHWGQL